MAGFFDPFSPGETTDPTAGVDPNTYAKVRQEWDTFLGNPQGRAALLSAGLALMQPPSFGDTGASQIGRAIGAAGESATTNQIMGMKEREQESKADLRGAQATAAEARAGTAEARAGAAGSRIELQKEQLRSMNERNLLGNRVRLSGMYQNYVKEVAKRNQDSKLIDPTKPPEPVLPIKDWIKQNPMLKSLGLVPPEATSATSEDDTEIPDTSPSTTTSSASSGAPQVGEVRKGYRYKGGNPADPANWEKV